jgi:PBSX family phage terminase large subunit
VTDTLTRRVYAPHGACAEAFERRDGEVVISGPAGTGKSRACLEKLHMMCLINPGMKGLIVRKTAASLGSTALDTYRKFVAAEALASGEVVFYGGSPQEAPQYRYANGSRIFIGGMDKASKIMSSEYDVIYVQEATELTITDWEHLNTRLRNGKVSFQQIIADCNPDRPTHWLKQRAESGATVMLYGRHEDNPVLFNRDGTLTEKGRAYIGILDNLTGVRKARLRYGKWVAAEGVIYEDFDPALHLVFKPKDPPHDWTRYWTVDFGYTHPFVLQCWAIDPDGRAFRYREIFHTGRTVAEHVATIKRCVVKADGTWKEPKPRAIICDHDAEDRATLTRELGLPTVAAKKTVSDGLQAVMQRLKPAGDGKPRLYYVRDALVERDQGLLDAGRPCCSEEEIGGYVWNEAKDAPVKEMDDGMDATRYLVAHLDLKARPNVRWM